MIIEQEYFKFITKGIPIKATNNNCIYYAETYEYFNNHTFRNFSIKTTLQGLAYYKTNNTEFEIIANNFLLSYKQPGKVIVDSTSLVRAMNIDINEDIMIEAFNVMGAGNKYDLENFSAGYFFMPDFFENVYPLQKNGLGLKLDQLISDIFNQNLTITEETFLLLAQEIITHEFANCKSLCNISPIKKSTKKELLKRLLKGKDFMEDNHLKNPSIAEIVKACNMTPFNFFREFKLAFGVSPNQYIMRKRMEHAQQLIMKEQPLASVAIACGFTDLFTFSKAFKKSFGESPSRYKTQTAK